MLDPFLFSEGRSYCPPCSSSHSHPQWLRAPFSCTSLYLFNQTASLPGAPVAVELWQRAPGTRAAPAPTGKRIKNIHFSSLPGQSVWECRRLPSAWASLRILQFREALDCVPRPQFQANIPCRTLHNQNVPCLVCFLKLTSGAHSSVPVSHTVHLAE